MKKDRKNKLPYKYRSAIKTLKEFKEAEKRILPFLPKPMQAKEYPNEWMADKPQNKWI